MTVHAYIADLNRERVTGTASTGQEWEIDNALVAVCGEHIGRRVNGGRAAEELRCFGLRRLATIWPLAGHNVDCPACRAEVRRLLGDRTDPEREARIAALTQWAEANPLRGADDSLEAEAQRRRMETRRRRERAARAANPLCACGRPKVKDKSVCGAEACALRRAIEVRRGIR